MQAYRYGRNKRLMALITFVVFVRRKTFKTMPIFFSTFGNRPQAGSQIGIDLKVLGASSIVIAHGVNHI